MTQEFVIYIGTQTIYTILKVAAPMLIAGLTVGLLVAIFQAVTQIHEMTLTFIPKILAVTLALIVFMPWMLNTILSFAIELFTSLPSFSK